jgi:hypothetical protein
MVVITLRKQVTALINQLLAAVEMPGKVNQSIKINQQL